MHSWVDIETMFTGFYQYSASTPAAIAGVVCFCFLLAFSGWRMYTARAWFMFTNIVALLMEVVGLGARVVSVNSPGNLAAYVVSTVFITVSLAPSVQAANVYMLAGRTIRRSTPLQDQNFRTLWLKPRYLAATFLTQDVLSFAVQLIGVGMLLNAIAGVKDGDVQSGRMLQRALNVLVVGFAGQIVTLCAFLAVIVRFQIKNREWRAVVGARGLRGRERVMGVGFYFAHMATLLLLIRTLYRLNEFVGEANGWDIFLVTQEWPFWVFEMAVVFWVVLFLTCVVPEYPGAWFTRGGPLEEDFEAAIQQALAGKQLDDGDP
ncbi:hypothetical protein Dda_3661 [Drechslerella dactyloides]|uniref:Uncharacterized protein n=1 Tax=Drechslerella dactyloides TaxID=74499 RepID=A0AAD6NIP6_DREDA|nr:hypothetical protein Dda_3661 [Drechslerella dactyloides]